VKIVAIKAFKYWRPVPYPPYPSWAILVIGLYYIGLFGFGVFGLTQQKKKINALLPVFGFIACLTITHSMLDTSLRYRLPLEPFLAFFAGAGLVRAVDWGMVKLAVLSKLPSWRTLPLGLSRRS
jgi:hypothetical protein